MAKKTGLYLNANAEITNNEVISKTTVDPTTLKRTTTYQNVNGNYNMGVYGRYSKDFKLDSIRKIKFRAGAWSNFSKNINFNNDIQYASKVTSFTPNIGVEYIWDKVLELKPYYRVTFTKKCLRNRCF